MNTLSTLPELEEFVSLCRPGRAIPLRVEVDADTETPVSAFLKIARDEKQAFLFESVEGGERSGRWSFLGARPHRIFRWNLGESNDPLTWITQELNRHRAIPIPGTPRFSGGLVGYLGYEAVTLFEPKVPVSKPKESDFPDAFLMDVDTVVAFDNLRHSVQIIAEVRCNQGDDPSSLYEEGLARIQSVLEKLSVPLKDVRKHATARSNRPARLHPRVSKVEYEASVKKARAYIRAGDCQQIVVSQRFDAEVKSSPFDIYRSLRRINPSPYLFFIQDEDRALVGSSPETLVKVQAGEVILRPLAGTRPRGVSVVDDLKLEAELKADPKENAEHMMLLDLGRNDVGRVAEIGSIQLDVIKEIERYSHVLHLVSQVRGKLSEGKTALDVLRAAFPAGTVTGSPKVRAMEIIDELEPAQRGPYSGCAGYFDRNGDMEMCIAIRTLLQSGKRVSIQAGAGIVFDSKAETEYQETVSKAGASFAAVAQAESGSLSAISLKPPTEADIPSYLAGLQ